MTVFPLHLIFIQPPGHGSTTFAVCDHGLTGLGHSHACRECGAAAAGYVTKPGTFGITDLCSHIVIVNAQGFCCHQAHRRARAADIRTAFNNHHGAVFVDVHLSTRLHADVEPKAYGDAAAGAFGHWLGVIRVFFRRLQAGLEAYRRKLWPVGGLCAFIGSIHHA